MTDQSTDWRAVAALEGAERMAALAIAREANVKTIQAEAEIERLRAALRYLLAFPGATEAQRRAKEALGDE
jgi:hypothetical protein